MTRTAALRAGRGFTLVELVIVILIMAIVAAIAGPKFFQAIPGFRVDAAANRIVADLKYAATLARVTSMEVTIEYQKGTKPDESEYRFKEIADPDKPGSFVIDDSSTWYTVILRNEPYRVVLKEAPGDVTYTIYGMPKDSRTFVVMCGTVSRTITVDKNSGDITVQ